LADVDEKRLLLSQLFTNFIQKERKIESKLTSVAQFLEEWILKLNESYELQKYLKNGVNKGRADSLVSATPIWLCILKIVRTHFAACGGEESPRPRAAPPRR